MGNVSAVRAPLGLLLGVWWMSGGQVVSSRVFERNTLLLASSPSDSFRGTTTDVTSFLEVSAASAVAAPPAGQAPPNHGTILMLSGCSTFLMAVLFLYFLDSFASCLEYFNPAFTSLKLLSLVDAAKGTSSLCAPL